MSTKLYKLLDEYRKAEIESSKSVKKVCKLPVTKTYALYFLCKVRYSKRKEMKGL